MVNNAMSSLDRKFMRVELREWSKQEGLYIPMPAKGSFGHDICPWCGDQDMRHYAEHVLAEHRTELKPYGRKAKANTFVLDWEQAIKQMGSN